MKGRPGVTLIELLLVIVIGSLLTLIALPSVNVARARAESAARSAQMAVSAASQRAILRQHDVVVEFHESSNQLRMFDDPNRNRRVDEGEATWNHRLEETISFTRGLAPAGPAGSDAVSFRDGPGGVPHVVFHRAGSASEAGGFYVGTPRSERANKYIDEVFAVTVRRATGRPRLHSVQHGDWAEAY